MKAVFADTFYFLALLNERHAGATHGFRGKGGGGHGVPD
jgi:hypothetical protein